MSTVVTQIATGVHVSNISPSSNEQCCDSTSALVLVDGLRQSSRQIIIHEVPDLTKLARAKVKYAADGLPHGVC